MEVVSYNSYAGFFKRFIAFLIDSFVVRVAIGMFFFRVGFWGHDDYDMFEWHNLFHMHTLAVELLMMAYFVLCESSSWQGTVGKKLLGMKVVNAKTLGRISTADAAIRFLGKYLSGAFLALGYIWIIFDERKQGWHDKLANTLVIEA